MEKPILIAEVKLKSPFGFKADKDWEALFKLADSHGDIISVHTEEPWGGSLEDVERARNLTSKPILAKGLHKEDQAIHRALEKGADYVLVVGRIPEDKLIPFCLIEPEDLAQLAYFSSKLSGKKAKLVWNSRNLKDGSLKSETFEQARAVHDGWLCQASNIGSVSDVKHGADAILIGQRLEDFLATVQ